MDDLNTTIKKWEDDNTLKKLDQIQIGNLVFNIKCENIWEHLFTQGFDEFYTSKLTDVGKILELSSKKDTDEKGEIIIRRAHITPHVNLIGGYLVNIYNKIFGTQDISYTTTQVKKLYKHKVGQIGSTIINGYEMNFINTPNTSGEHSNSFRICSWGTIKLYPLDYNKIKQYSKGKEDIKCGCIMSTKLHIATDVSNTAWLSMISNRINTTFASITKESTTDVFNKMLGVLPEYIKQLEE